MPDDLAPSLEAEKGYDHGDPAGIQWLGRNQRPNEYAAEEREYVPELRWPGSVRVLERMRNDAKIAEVLRAIVTPILGARRWLDPNGARPDIVRHIAQDLGVPILGSDEKQPITRTRDRFNLGEHLRLALELSLVFGHMPFEQVYRIQTEPLAARLRKLAPRMPQTLAEIVTERDGGLKGIRQNPPGDLNTTSRAPMAYMGEQPLLGVDRLVMYSFGREGAAWQGRSILRSCYREWRYKDEALRNQATMMRRNGLGQPVYRGAEGESETQLEKGLLGAVGSRVGEKSGAAVPFGASLTFEGVRGTLPDYVAYIRQLDEAIAGSMLAEVLKLGSSATGSRALGETFADVLTQWQQQMSGWLFDDVFNPYVIEDLVDVNWGENEQAPRLVVEQVGVDHELTFDAIVGLIQAGALTADDELEAYLRDRGGLPKQGTPRPPAVQPAAARARARRSPAAAAVGDAEDDDEASTGQEAADSLDAEWQTALIALLLLYRRKRHQDVEDIVARVRDLAVAGDLAGLTGLTATATGEGVDAIAQAMGQLASTGAASAVREAAAQGVALALPDTGALAAGLRARAAVVDDLLTSGLANSAVREATRKWGLTPDDLAAEVRTALEQLSDAWVEGHLGGALTSAQNAGRGVVFQAGPKATFTAFEVLDATVCRNCAQVAGQTYPTWQDALVDYPNGQYRSCLGRERCRGFLLASYLT